MPLGICSPCHEATLDLTKSHLICGFPIIITTASILNPGFMLRLPIELLPLCPKSWLLLTTIVFSVQKSLSRVVYGVSRVSSLNQLLPDPATTCPAVY